MNAPGYVALEPAAWLRRSARVFGDRVAVIDDDTIPGTRRFYAEDPWGNRLEFVESQA